MKRKILATVAVLVLLVGGGLLMSQEPPAMPHPPQVFFQGEGTGWLGVQLSDVTEQKARDLKLSGEYGVIVEDVDEDSPAAKAGLAKRDVIVEFGGERVRSVAQFQRLVRETPPGRAVALQVIRAGATRTLNVKLDRSRGPFVMPQMPLPQFGNQNFFYEFNIKRGASLGISGDDLTRQLANYFGVKQGKGVLVREVLVGSAAEKAGLKAGDVIVRVDSLDVSSVADLRRALSHDPDEKRKVTLTIVRDRHEQTLAVELQPEVHSPLRSVEWFGLPGLDPAELERQSAEYRKFADQVPKEVEAYQRQLREESLRWQQELRKKMTEEQHLPRNRNQFLDEQRRQKMMLESGAGII